MALDPEQIAALPTPVRRRFLRLYRTFQVGLMFVLVGISVAVLVSGRLRTLALILLGAGALIIGGTFLYAFKAGYRVAPPPPSQNGTTPPEQP